MLSMLKKIDYKKDNSTSLATEATPSGMPKERKKKELTISIKE